MTQLADVVQGGVLRREIPFCEVCLTEHRDDEDCNGTHLLACQCGAPIASEKTYRKGKRLIKVEVYMCWACYEDARKLDEIREKQAEDWKRVIAAEEAEAQATFEAGKKLAERIIARVKLAGLTVVNVANVSESLGVSLDMATRYIRVLLDYGLIGRRPRP